MDGRSEVFRKYGKTVATDNSQNAGWQTCMSENVTIHGIS